jgi:hypothetical protein
MRTEGPCGDDPRDYDDLLDEIAELERELDERPTQEEVRIFTLHRSFFLTAQ